MKIKDRVVTPADVMALFPCERYDEIKVRNLMRGKPRPLSYLLKLDHIPSADRVWAVVQLVEPAKRRIEIICTMFVGRMPAFPQEAMKHALLELLPDMPHHEDAIFSYADSNMALTINRLCSARNACGIIPALLDMLSADEPIGSKGAYCGVR